MYTLPGTPHSDHRPVRRGMKNENKRIESDSLRVPSNALLRSKVSAKSSSFPVPVARPSHPPQMQAIESPSHARKCSRRRALCKCPISILSLPPSVTAMLARFVLAYCSSSSAGSTCRASTFRLNSTWSRSQSSAASPLSGEALHRSQP